jgi:RNA polymerase sigma-70 factor (ECF subfamily)
VPRLASIFAAASGAPLSDDLEPALAAFVARARAASPELAVPAEDFIRHVGARVAGGGDGDADPVGALDDLHAGDLYLACACARNDPAAIAMLERSFLADVPRWLGRLRLPAGVVDEVRQLVRERVLVGDPPRIADYAGRGPLGGWLRIVTLRIASDLRANARPSGAAGAPVLPVIDPEVLLIKRRYGEAFGRAFADAFSALSAEDRNMFRLSYIDGLNLDRMAVVLQVSRATAGRRMLAAKQRLLDTTLRLLGERLRVDAEELKSLLDVLRSGIEISLPGLLAEHVA